MASALAIRVLLHPGGPYIKIPLGGRIPSLRNAYGKTKRRKKDIRGGDAWYSSEDEKGLFDTTTDNLSTVSPNLNLLV